MPNFLPTEYSGASPARGHHTMPQPTTYIFPMLKTTEIVHCMKEMGIELAKPELTEPNRHKEKVRKVFWLLLEHCRGITEEDLLRQVPNLEAVQSVAQFPELHDSLTDLQFFREMREFLKICGVYDFSWKDLHHPSAKRFRCQLSAIINLAKFREDQLQVYWELNEPRTQLLNELHRVQLENEELEAKFREVEAESNVKMEEIDFVVRECEELEGEIGRSNKAQAAKREEAAQLKKEANTMKEELASATWALQEAEAEEGGLMAQVVSSPNRKKQEVDTKKNRLEKEKNESRSLQENIQQNQVRTAHLKQSIKNVQDTIRLQQQLLEEAAKLSKSVKQVSETEGEMQANDEKTSEIIGKVEEAERGLMRSEEKVTHLRKQGKMKMDAAIDRLETAREQLQIVEKERRDGMARIESGEGKVKGLETQLQEEKEQTEQDIDELITEYKETEKLFCERNEKRMTIIQAVM